MGNSKEYRDSFFNRGDTSSGSAFVMKTLEKNGINATEQTRVMRKTNFILGFKTRERHI